MDVTLVHNFYDNVAMGATKKYQPQIWSSSQNPMVFFCCKWALQFVGLKVQKKQANLRKKKLPPHTQKGLPLQRLKLRNSTKIS